MTLRAAALIAILCLTSCDAPPPPPNATIHKDWKIPNNGRWIHLPESTDSDGTGYLSSFQGLEAIDEHTGYVKWTSPSTPKEEWEFAVRPANLVLAYPRALKSDSTPRYLRALDAKTGTARWQYESFNGASRPVVVADRQIWILSRAGDLVSLELATGKPTTIAQFRQDAVSPGDLNLAIASCNQTLLVARGQKGVLEARDLQTGSLRWVRKFDGPLRALSISAQIEATFLAANDSIVIAVAENGIVAADAATGKDAWSHRFQLKNYYRTNFQLLGNTFFWTDHEGKADTLHALDAASGRELWTVEGLEYLPEREFVRAVGDLWVVPTAAAVTVLSRDGKKLATVPAFVANTAGEQSFTSQGDFGYTLEAAPPPKGILEPVQRTTRETSSLITFRLRTGEIVSKKPGRGIYDLAIRNGRLLMVTSEGLQSAAIPTP